MKVEIRAQTPPKLIISLTNLNKLHSIITDCYVEFLTSVESGDYSAIDSPNCGICKNMQSLLSVNLSNIYGIELGEFTFTISHIYSYSLIRTFAPDWEHPLKHLYSIAFPIDKKHRDEHLWTGEQLEARISLLKYIISTLKTIPTEELITLTTAETAYEVEILYPEQLELKLN